ADRKGSVRRREHVQFKAGVEVIAVLDRDPLANRVAIPIFERTRNDASRLYRDPVNRRGRQVVGDRSHGKIGYVYGECSSYPVVVALPTVSEQFFDQKTQTALVSEHGLLIPLETIVCHILNHNVWKRFSIRR